MVTTRSQANPERHRIRYTTAGLVNGPNATRASSNTAAESTATAAPSTRACRPAQTTRKQSSGTRISKPASRKAKSYGKEAPTKSRGRKRRRRANSASSVSSGGDIPPYEERSPYLPPFVIPSPLPPPPPQLPASSSPRPPRRRLILKPPAPPSTPPRPPRRRLIVRPPAPPAPSSTPAQPPRRRLIIKLPVSPPSPPPPHQQPVSPLAPYRRTSQDTLKTGGSPTPSNPALTPPTLTCEDGSAAEQANPSIELTETQSDQARSQMSSKDDSSDSPVNQPAEDDESDGPVDRLAENNETSGQAEIPAETGVAANEAAHVTDSIEAEYPAETTNANVDNRQRSPRTPNNRPGRSSECISAAQTLAAMAGAIGGHQTDVSAEIHHPTTSSPRKRKRDSGQEESDGCRRRQSISPTDILFIPRDQRRKTTRPEPTVEMEQASVHNKTGETVLPQEMSYQVQGTSRPHPASGRLSRNGSRSIESSRRNADGFRAPSNQRHRGAPHDRYNTHKRRRTTK